MHFLMFGLMFEVTNLNGFHCFFLFVVLYEFSQSRLVIVSRKSYVGTGKCTLVKYAYVLHLKQKVATLLVVYGTQ